MGLGPLPYASTAAEINTTASLIPRHSFNILMTISLGVNLRFISGLFAPLSLVVLYITQAVLAGPRCNRYDCLLD